LAITMLLHDVRHALRWLRANPGFTAAAWLVLALSIGVTTATFSVVYGVVLQPLPVEQPDRLIRVWSSQPERNLPFFSVSPADFADWRARSRVLSQLAAYEGAESAVVTRGAEGELLTTSRLTAELFPLLGARPLLGRFLDASENQPGAGRSAVIAFGLWQRRFGGRPDVLGQTLVLDDEPWTIVGVAPPEFAVPNNTAEVWLPMQSVLESQPRARRYLRVLARLRDGATFDDARAELARIAADLGREYPATNRGWGVNMRPLTETVVSPATRQSLLVLLGAVALVLLVACANVAALLISRATARRREMAVRTALGASRSTLVRQMLIESLVLAAASGASGILLAMWCVDGLRRLAADTIPRIDEVGLAAPVVLVAVGISAATAIVFGLVPAMSLTRGALKWLRTRDASQGPGDSRGRDLLVMTEVALAVVLLVGAALLARSFVRLQSRSLGFDADRLLLVELAAPERPAKTEDRTSLYEQLLASLAALPGVDATAATSGAPFAGRNSGNFFTIVGRPALPGESPDTDFRMVSASYLRTLRIPIVRGRDLTDADGPSAPGVVISAAAARRYWPDSEPVGAHIQFGNITATVVGVAGDARYLAIDAPDEDLRPMMYLPHRLLPDRPLAMVVRTTGDPAATVASVRETARHVAPRLPIARIVLMRELLAEARGPQQFSATVLAAFAWIALILAAAGLWGLISYSVAQRTREIGIRVALGATPREVIRITAVRGLAVAVCGLGIGLFAAANLGGAIERLLYGIAPTDAATFVAIAVTFLAVAAAASILPARRALRIDPVEALRSE
jgi:putative ABC transport system permease protein